MPRFFERLGLRYPIIQAPMAGINDHKLMVAVAGEGALASLPCAMLTPSAMLSEIDAFLAAGSHPYNLNFFCHTQPTVDVAREQAWREALAEDYARFGIDPASVTAGAGRAPFSHELADALEPLRPPVMSFHFGLPAPELLARVRSWGSVILGCATSVAEAKWLEQSGVDAVIVQGVEAGGHRGMFLDLDVGHQTGLFTLLPQVVNAVRLPVIAAGGIVDTCSVQAAFALGADMVQIGTAYMLCPEANTSAVHRAALSSSGEHVTALTNLFTGRPARGIVNGLMRKFGAISPLAPEFPLAGAALVPLRAAAEKQGSGDYSPLWSGSNRSGCKSVPAAQLTREFARSIPAGFGSR